jgi:pyruvate carboxylase
MTEKNSNLESLCIDDVDYYTTLTSKYKSVTAWEPLDTTEIKAVLPGTVTKILVKEGDKVKEGQTVAQFEAMKMINNVQALTDGVVSEIHIKVGDIFHKGVLLMKLSKG